MISLKTNSHSDNDWNQNLLNSSLGTIFQTKEYATYMKSRFGSEPLFLKFFNDDKLIAQLLAFYSPKISGKITKILGRGKIYSSLLKIANFFPHYLHWIYGPVIFNYSYKKQILDTLGNFLVLKKYNFIGSSHPLELNLFFHPKFKFHQEKTGTFVIDLRNGIEQITENLDKRSTIKNIQRSQKRGVVITEINSKDDIFQYFKLQKESRTKNNLVSYSLEDIEEGMKIMKPLGSTGFLAWLDKRPVGGILINSFNGYIIQSGSTRSELDSTERLHSQDLLKWHIIQCGIKNNYRYYDLAGIKLTNKNSKEEGIYMHKKKWGGKLIEYPTFKNF